MYGELADLPNPGSAVDGHECRGNPADWDDTQDEETPEFDPGFEEEDEDEDQDPDDPFEEALRALEAFEVHQGQCRCEAPHGETAEDAP